MMSPFRWLTDDNFMMYAMKAYNNPRCLDIDEFHNDLRETKYIKRLLNRFINKNELKHRLIINHIMVLYNMFGAEAATRILFFKIDEEFWSCLKPFLVSLGMMPEIVYGIHGEDIISSDIEMNDEIVEALREDQ